MIKRIAEFIQRLLDKSLSEKYRKIDENLDAMQRENERLSAEVKGKQELQGQLEAAQITINDLRGLVSEKDFTPVDIWCRDNGLKPVEKVYQDKLYINKIFLPCDLRELIIPNSAVVQQIRGKIQRADGNKMLWYQRVMQYINDVVEWTDDGRYDTYNYPSMTLSTGKGDCDDHVFAQASVEPEFGGAWGFKHRPDGSQGEGHAWCVAVINGELWNFDSVSSTMSKYEPKKGYYIHYIVTKNQVWQLDGTVEFGKILWP